MKTKADLEKLAVSVGATLEEDHGYRDVRVFQIVAPDGQRWIDGGAIHIRIDWARGRTPDAVAFNNAEFNLAKETVECGLEPIPADEAYLYAEE